MNPAYLNLGLSDICLVAAVFLLAVGLQYLLGLQLTRDFLVAGLRMFGQLFVVGWVLLWVFQAKSVWVSVGVALAMVGVASYTAWSRVRRTQASPFRPSPFPFLVALASGVGLASALGIGAILRPVLWFDPQYLIPLVGMVTGNTMNVSTLAAERFIGVVAQDAHLVESLLALGVSAEKALESYKRQALRVSLMPTLNTMMVVGVVSLPGMMTGQILAGASPSQAVRYQMLIHSLILVSALIVSFLSIGSIGKRLIVNEERLAWRG